MIDVEYGVVRLMRSIQEVCSLCWYLRIIDDPKHDSENCWVLLVNWYITSFALSAKHSCMLCFLLLRFN